MHLFVIYTVTGITNGMVYAASTAGDVYVFAAEPTFRLLAHSELGEAIRATPAVANGRLYIRGQHHLFCIGTKYELPGVNNK